MKVTASLHTPVSVCCVVCMRYLTVPSTKKTIPVWWHGWHGISHCSELICDKGGRQQRKIILEAVYFYRILYLASDFLFLIFDTYSAGNSRLRTERTN